MWATCEPTTRITSWSPGRTRALETMLTSLPAGDVPQRADEVNYVMVVADGMGGHAAGEVASRLAISGLVGLALDVPDWISWVDEDHVPEIGAARPSSRTGDRGDPIERGHQDAALRGMGSTMTGVRSPGATCWSPTSATRARTCYVPDGWIA